LPFKLNQNRRHHIPRQQHKVTNSLGARLRSGPACDASLRQRSSLTVWFTDEAIAAWAAELRTTQGGQPLSASLTSLRGIAARWCSPLAILTALTLRTVFRLAYRQAEGLIGSIIGLLGLSLRVPDHTTLSRRAATLDVPRPGNAGAGAGSEPMHLLVDSTGLKLCGKGEWLLEKHGTATRRSWRMLHLGVDAGTGRIVAATLTSKDVDDASQAGPLLDQVAGAVASFTGDGAYDGEPVYRAVTERHPQAAVVIPPRATAVPSDTAEARRPCPARRTERFAGHRRARAHGVAECVWIQQARPGRSQHEPVEAGDRRRVARAYGRAPGDRGGGRCSRAQPHAGARTPKLRPRRLISDGIGINATTPLIPAPR